MTKAAPDDYEAVRTVVAALEPFESRDQERILRWAREKLGLAPTSIASLIGESGSEPLAEDSAVATALTRSKDIKTFMDQKKPESESQLAASVAYYYRFEAPQHQRKDAITKDDLQEACRQIGRTRLKHPAQTLVNAHAQGYLDKGVERGTYVINTVGENLVAMALPEGSGAGTVATTRHKRRKRATLRRSKDRRKRTR
jgi:hypothetical protein